MKWHRQEPGWVSLTAKPLLWRKGRERRLGKDGEERTNEKRKQMGFNEQIALDSPD